jgi:flagellar export protein FliJ
MKRFRFSLKELLDLREFREREAEMALSVKTGKVRLIEIELERLAAEAVRTRKGRFTLARTIMDYLADERYLERLESEKEKRLVELTQAILEREKALQDYHEASKKKKALEKMEEGELGAYKKEADRKEILDIDDIITGARTRRQLNFAGKA